MKKCHSSAQVVPFDLKKFRSGSPPEPKRETERFFSGFEKYDKKSRPKWHPPLKKLVK